MALATLVGLMIVARAINPSMFESSWVMVVFLIVGLWGAWSDTREMTLITLRLPEDLLEIINSAAQEYYGGDRSKMMREILWTWVEKQGDKDDKPTRKSDQQAG